MDINLTDITNVTDEVLDIFLRCKGGEDGVSVEHLTVTERSQLADLMGWERSARTTAWIAPWPSVKAAAGADFEGAILRRQENDGWE